MILNPRASKEQKVEAVGKVAEVTAQEAVKTTARKIATPKRQEAVKEAVRKALNKYGGAVPIVGPAVKAAQTVLEQMPTEAKLRRAETARRKTNAALKAVEKNLKRKLTRKERATLDKQHFDFFYRNP